MASINWIDLAANAKEHMTMPQYHFTVFELNGTKVPITKGFVNVIWPEHIGGLGRWSAEVYAEQPQPITDAASGAMFKLSMESDENGFCGQAFLLEMNDVRLVFRGHGPLGGYHVPLAAASLTADLQPEAKPLKRA